MADQAHPGSAAVLCALLRQTREERGLRQKELADILNLPQSYISKVESGERRLDVLELREICLALGVSLADFTAQLEERLGQ
jgi:transcriptional regulator with XRE-family HTH domain